LGKKYAFIFIFAVLYILAGVVLYLYNRRIPLEVSWLWLIEIVIVVVVLLWTRRWEVPLKPTESNVKELVFSVGYAAVYILLTALFWKQFFGKSIVIYPSTKRTTGLPVGVLFSVLLSVYLWRHQEIFN
jgi:hypothetical protein